MEAHDSDPTVIHCYRTKRMRLSNGKFIPYNEWSESDNDTPCHSNFITGVSGVIYPPEFLEYLKRMGDEFRSTCLQQDDVWLTVNALRAGLKIAQLRSESRMFKVISSTQKHALYNTNVVEGGSHHQLVKTFTEEDMSKLETLMGEEMN